MLRYIAIPFLLITAACSGPNEQDYCARYGVSPGSPDYPSCTNYYFQQQAAFRADRQVCDAVADRTYPPTLYSRPQSFPVRYHGYGGFGHTEMVHVGADYQQIAQVDALRMRIIQPCMHARGWNSGETWQAGRHQPHQTATRSALPWLKSK